MNRTRMTLLALAMASPLAHAAGVVSFSVDDNNTIGGGGTAVQASSIDSLATGGSAGGGDFAGLVNADYWGNTWNGSGQVFSPTNLLDDDGIATTIDISLNTNLTWSAGAQVQDSDGNWNRTMLSGYANGTSVTLTVMDVPYAVYDIYVYFMSDNGTRVGNVSDGSTTLYFGMSPDSVQNNNPALFTQATATTSVGYATDANYAVFSGISGNHAFTVNTFAADGTTPDFGGISGFQIVQVPEPSIALLGGLGLFGLLRRRRA